MPDRPPATSDPSETERLLRETVLWRFESPDHVELLTRFTDFVFTLAVEGGFWGATHGRGVVAGSLQAGARDLRHLVGFLREVAETSVHASVSPEELALCRRAAEWADYLERAAEGLEEAAGEPPEAEDGPGG